MPRYKSISEFRHTVVIQGKKYLVGPEDVIESPSSISYIFLQEVDAKTPITVSTPFSGGQHVQNLKKQVEKEQSSTQQSVAKVSETVETTNTAVEELRKAFETFVARYEKETQDLTEQINKQFADVETVEAKNKEADTAFKEVVNRRLGILKDAVRTMEDEVFGPQDDPLPKN
jgi:hypothetical protein